MVQDGRAFKPSTHRYPSVQITRPNKQNLDPKTQSWKQSKKPKKKKISKILLLHTPKKNNFAKLLVNDNCNAALHQRRQPNRTRQQNTETLCTRERRRAVRRRAAAKTELSRLQICVYAPPFPLLRCTATSLPVEDCLLPSTLTNITLYSFRTYLIALQELK
jgi:hypothetical protein